MSIKGFPNQKKLTNPLPNLTTKINKSEFVTVQPSSSDKLGLDTVNNGLYRIHAVAKTVSAVNSAYSKRSFTSASHGAKIGDVARFEVTATNPGFESNILDTPDANTIVLANEVPLSIVISDSFFILRYVTGRYAEDGSAISSSSPIKYLLNSIETVVLQDTITPSNSKPLPVVSLNSAGVAIDPATSQLQVTGNTSVASIDTKTPTIGQKTMANSRPVVLSSDQSSIPVVSTLATATFSGVTVLQNAVSATGNGSSLTVTGYGTTLLQISGTFVATINFEASADAGATWVSILSTQIGISDVSPTATTPGLYRITSAGVDLIRARVTWTSGTSITINGRATNAENASKVVRLASGSNSVGSIIANAGANLNTSALNLETTQSAMSAKLPATIGQKPMATSFAVAIASDQSSLPISNQTDINSSGTLGALNAAVPISSSGSATVVVELTGTWVGTVTFEGSNNNFVTSQPVVSVFLGGPQIAASTATTNGFYSVLSAGFAKVQARVSAYTSGSASVLVNSASGLRIVVPLNLNPDNNITKPGAAVTTVAPTYTNGTTNPLSLNTSGGLRVESSVSDVTASGTITTQNLVPAGAATAGSAVASGSLNGAATGLIQVTGTYTGALSLQFTVDGTNWITVGGTPFLNIATGALSATIASSSLGIFEVEITGAPQYRITGLAAMTGTATVSIRSSRAAGLVGINTSLPVGTNILGALVANQSINTAQINGVATLVGPGATGTGAQRVTTGNVAAATLANITSSITNQTALASGAARMGASFYNESSSIAYLKLGATASSTSYTIQMAANSYYELPQPCYSGIIDVIWVSAAGAMRVTSW